MTTGLGGLIESGREIGHPAAWPRAVVDKQAWGEAVLALTTRRLIMFGLWGEKDAVHLALGDDAGKIGIVSLDCAGGRFPSVGLHHPPALRLEP